MAYAARKKRKDILSSLMANAIQVESVVGHARKRQSGNTPKGWESIGRSSCWKSELIMSAVALECRHFVSEGDEMTNYVRYPYLGARNERTEPSKPKWTPGPWRAEADQDRIDFSILGGHTYQVRVAIEVSEPDAILIVSVLDLLATLEAAPEPPLNPAEAIEYTRCMRRWYQTARAEALKRAKGE